MPDLRIVVTANEAVPLADIRKVYEACSWGWPGDERAQIAMKNSYLKVLAYEDEQPVAFTRILSDGLAYAFIVDTRVHPSRRGHGIGRALMRRLLDELQRRGIAYAMLLSSAEGLKLYESLGFLARKPTEPGMILRLA